MILKHLPMQLAPIDRHLIAPTNQVVCLLKCVDERLYSEAIVGHLARAEVKPLNIVDQRRLVCQWKDLTRKLNKLILLKKLRFRQRPIKVYIGKVVGAKHRIVGLLVVRLTRWEN